MSAAAAKRRARNWPSCGSGVRCWQVATFLTGLQLMFVGRLRGVLRMQQTPSPHDAARAQNAEEIQHAESIARKAEHVPEVTVEATQRTRLDSVEPPVMMPIPQQSSFDGQWVHWVVVSHCSAQMLLQVNMMLTSAFAVGQPGEFTWILYGCNSELQWTHAATHIPHPRCNIWRTTAPIITHPSTHEKYGNLLELSRSSLVARWWKVRRPPEAAIGILNADFIWLRAVHLKANPRTGSYRGPWETKVAEPMKASGASYDIGCMLSRFKDREIRAICGEQEDACLAATKDVQVCTLNYASGPPWILHRDDAERVFGAWPEAAVRIHTLMNDGIAEQAAFGVAQMRYGVKSELDAFWFLSAPADVAQERQWNAIAQSNYDPCHERKPPSAEEAFAPIFWACLTHEIPHLKNMGYKMHKHHVHADLLDCDVGLLEYPPREALERYKDQKDNPDFRSTWSVCMYINVLNSHAKLWKGSFCKNANVQPNVPVAVFEAGFHELTGTIADLFPEGHAALPSEGNDDIEQSEMPAPSVVSQKEEQRLEHVRGSGHNSPNDKGQSVHWVFTTECSAYQFNQGNLLLASARHVDQPGEFTWIMIGCTTQEQKDFANQLIHPRARVWHTSVSTPIHPSTGKPYKNFAASNRPVAINAWWRTVKPKEETIGVLDPDEIFLRPVLLKENPRIGSYRGPWEAHATKHKQATAAYYGLGCIAQRFTDDQLRHICGSHGEACVRSKRRPDECTRSYASGPPWLLHRSDMDDVFSVFLDTAIKVHELWPQIFAEQSSYGFSQTQFGVTSVNDAFWMLSSINDPPQEKLWDIVAASLYDPCKERAPPPADEDLPVLWHACLTYVMPRNENENQFNLHKDHIHKDLLDCDAPLIRWPPEDSLSQYHGARRAKSHDFRSAWSVCTYTNLINTYARHWKTRWCKEPNLKATYRYPGHSNGFLNPKSRIRTIFRPGGWSDVSYSVA
eukprot:TRINITY_DN12267_c0_g2_i1.p1 TRINITY_DN12267_c0_g2~~TRINITY_DN12267_c0_g2_i1.p1  ORF type:complete len:964 (-),score=103.26 TRINITY_DN12267_c0_g2_i1:108-2999(-)